jgi:hypothetical protein
MSYFKLFKQAPREGGEAPASPPDASWFGYGFRSALPAGQP